MNLELVRAYLSAGLGVLPAQRDGDAKRVALRTWKPYQQRLPTDIEVRSWFANHHDSLCLVCGKVSGNLEMIDFDLAGEAFEPWCDLVRQAAPGLLERLVIESTPSGGQHVVYRCDAGVSPNLKLAQRRLVVPDETPVVIGSKTFLPRRDPGGGWSVLLTLIETRGEGGIFLCAPSVGYTVTQGNLTALPRITGDEREALLCSAWMLNQVRSEPEPIPVATANAIRPGDDYARHADVRTVLLKHGWTRVQGGENEYWRRPGRTSGWSASLRDGVFYVFSSNAAPFEPDKAYGPFSVYSLLEHHGDFTAAARALRAEGFGADPPSDVDIAALIGQPPNREPTKPVIIDPGPMPEELLRLPGFVGAVMDHCIQTAPYPNPVMAFCGALALQAFLAGRKVRDPGDNRTNIYLLGLAHSAAGKDWPRKLNTRIVHEIGLAESLGDRFASGEGIQDALFTSPSMLFQTDEIDGMLQSINKAKDARHENVMGTLLTMYSASNSVFPMRRKAGKEAAGSIDQPCLVIFGTAIPNHYYEALSERMLTNGFFARMMILEAGARAAGREPRITSIPPGILETAQWWADYRPGGGNLPDEHPDPTIVEHTDEAQRLLIETREQAEAEYGRAESSCDPVGTTVWGRVSEQVRKLALLHAISADHRAPRIDAQAVRWASQFVLHQTRRMLFMAASHVADNPFHAECLKAVEKLRSAPGGELPHSVLLKRMKMDTKAFGALIETLCQQGDVEVVTASTPGRTMRAYRLVGGG